MPSPVSIPRPLPTWLPEPLALNGDWPSIHAQMWDVFQRDVVAPLFYRGRPVWHDRRKSEDEFPEGYWHVTHRDEYRYDTRTRRREFVERIYDPERACRLPWLRPMLEHPDDPAVLAWEYQEDDGRMASYVWLKDWNYLTVMGHYEARMGLVRNIITVYVTDSTRKREQLEDKYANRNA